MRIVLTLTLVAALLSLAGCRTPIVAVTVSNHTAHTIPLIEVDYPSASFGTENLSPGADYNYRLQVLGSGPTKVIYTDDTRKEKKATGPSLKEGDRGHLSVVFNASGVQWIWKPTGKH